MQRVYYTDGSEMLKIMPGKAFDVLSQHNWQILIDTHFTARTYTKVSDTH